MPLTHLSLVGQPLTGEGLRHVSAASLETLVLRQCPNLADATLGPALAGLSALKSLSLPKGSGQVTGELLAQLSLAPLGELDFSGCTTLTDGQLARLKDLPLRSLKLDSEHLSDAGLVAALAPMPLENLAIGTAKGLTGAAFAVLKDKPLARLALSGCGNLTDGALAHLAAMPSLKRLQLWNCSSLTDAGLPSLAGLQLTALALTGSRLITDEGLTHLVRLPLEELDLDRSGVSCQAMALLQLQAARKRLAGLSPVAPPSPSMADPMVASQRVTGARICLDAMEPAPGDVIPAPEFEGTGRFRIPFHAGAGVEAVRAHPPDLDRQGQHGREGGHGPVGGDGEGNRVMPYLDLVGGQFPHGEPTQLRENVHVQGASVALLGAVAQHGHDLLPVPPGLLLGPVEWQGIELPELEPLFLGGAAAHAADEPPWIRPGGGDPEDQAGGLGVGVVLSLGGLSNRPCNPQPGRSRDWHSQVSTVR